MFFTCPLLDAAKNKDIYQLADKKRRHRSNNNSKTLPKNPIVCRIHVLNTGGLFPGDPPTIRWRLHRGKKHDKSVADQDDSKPAYELHSFSSIIFIHDICHYKYHGP